MLILYGEELVNHLRNLADSIHKRLWIAVPYLGGQKTLFQVLGRNWIDNPEISVKLITDASDLTNLNPESLKHFFERGLIRSILGLHAKIYILDNTCILTSANLTQTAFAKRYEIGIQLDKSHSKKVISIYDNWFNRVGAKIENLTFENIVKTPRKSKEEKKGQSLPTLWQLPTSPFIGRVNYKRKFMHYNHITDEYKTMSEIYADTQRIWKNVPLYLEIDAFLNFLFNDHPKQVSRNYKKKYRRLNIERQKQEIKKYATEFKNSLSDDYDGWISEKMKTHRVFRNKLKPKAISSLTKKDFQIVFDRVNGLNSYPINKIRILNNNSILQLRSGFACLLDEKQELPARMTGCSSLNWVGSTTMNEILGHYYPKKYPIVNKNSNSGMRFFGFNLKD